MNRPDRARGSCGSTNRGVRYVDAKSSHGSPGRSGVPPTAAMPMRARATGEKPSKALRSHELLAPLPHNEQQRVAAHVFVLVAVERWLFSDDSRCPRPLTGSASRHRPRRSALAVRSAGKHSSGCFRYRVKHHANPSSTCRQFTCTPSQWACATVRPVAVGINGLEPYRLRITARRFEIAPRDLRVGLRALWRVDLSEAKDCLHVAILNGERVAV